MEQKLTAVLVLARAGQVVSVTATCAELGISRQTFYKYKRRFEEEGLDGVAERSRRPLSSPTTTSPQLVEQILLARKQLEADGWDNGAISIRAWLLRTAETAPAVRTVHRVLVRSGVIDPEPKKRPRSSYKRFRFPHTDDCWQIDGFEHTLLGGVVVCIFEIQDDHSRYEVETRVWRDEETAGAWLSMTTAIGRYGQPYKVLSDNGLAFTGRRMGMRVLFEKNLERIGVKLINSSPRHPQTCGKNERLHKTLQQWLRKQPPVATMPELQTQLDTYRHAYNHDRPHQSLNMITPWQARLAGIRITPLPDQPPRQAPTTAITTVLDARGTVGINRTRIAVGQEYANLPITMFHTAGHLIIFHNEHVLRELILDPALHYHPLGRPRQPRTKKPVEDTGTVQPQS
jgi:transposase InsO family protein